MLRLLSICHGFCLHDILHSSCKYSQFLCFSKTYFKKKVILCLTFFRPDNHSLTEQPYHHTSRPPKLPNTREPQKADRRPSIPSFRKNQFFPIIFPSRGKNFPSRQKFFSSHLVFFPSRQVFSEPDMLGQSSSPAYFCQTCILFQTDGAYNIYNVYLRRGPAAARVVFLRKADQAISAKIRKFAV